MYATIPLRQGEILENLMAFIIFARKVDRATDTLRFSETDLLTTTMNAKQQITVNKNTSD